VATFEDKVSGAKGRDKRPQFDALLKEAIRREFDMIAVWSSDRLGRSMSHLIEVLETIKGTGVGLFRLAPGRALDPNPTAVLA
jgi:DNA invertase Pin-like site-specific DNA recombinase